MRRLAALPHPKAVVLGNHDAWWGCWGCWAACVCVWLGVSVHTAAMGAMWGLACQGTAARGQMPAERVACRGAAASQVLADAAWAHALCPCHGGQQRRFKPGVQPE